MKVAERVTAERFRELCATLTQREIGLELGIAQSGVSRLCKIFGVSAKSGRRPATGAVDEQQFRELCATLKRAEVAERLGISAQSVLHLERRYGVRAASAYLQPHITREAYVDMCERGMTRADIAAATGLSTQSIGKYIQRYGARPAKGRMQPRLSREEFAKLAPTHTPKEIAAISNLTYGRIIQLASEYKIKCKRDVHFIPTPKRSAPKPPKPPKVQAAKKPATNGKPMTIKPQRRGAPAAPVRPPKLDMGELRAKVADDVAAFMARGGKILVGPAPGTDPGRPPARAWGQPYQ